MPFPGDVRHTEEHRQFREMMLRQLVGDKYMALEQQLEQLQSENARLRSDISMLGTYILATWPPSAYPLSEKEFEQGKGGPIEVAIRLMKKLRAALEAVDSVYHCVLEVTRDHAHLWQDRDDFFWLRRIREEVSEANATLRLLGDIEKLDTLEWELAQIASIAINWLAKRHREGHPLPNPVEIAARHGCQRQAALGEDGGG